MSHLSVKEVGEKLAKAGRLGLRPLCIYSADAVPAGVVKVSDVVKTGNRCLAKALLLIAAGEADGFYVSRELATGICHGSLLFLGLAEFPAEANDMFSTVGHGAMFLKESPECAGRTIQKMGKITFPGKFLIIQACEKQADAEPLAYVCFGKAEEIRNLCGLIHFGSDEPFGKIDAAWGSGCETFIAYPAGMVSGAPKDTAFIGPNAPDGNSIFPRDMMVVGIPAKMADRMAGNVESSFVVKCADSTYPAGRDAEVSHALKKKGYQ